MGLVLSTFLACLSTLIVSLDYFNSIVTFTVGSRSIDTKALEAEKSVLRDQNKSR